MNIATLNYLSLSLRIIHRVLRNWKILVIITIALSPIGPHVWVGTLFGNSGYNNCTYLGARGIVTKPKRVNCHLLLIIDRREIL